MELRTGDDKQFYWKTLSLSKSITQKAAERALILSFYKSQQINWVLTGSEVLEMIESTAESRFMLSP